MFGLSSLAVRIAVALVLALLLVGILWLNGCEKRRSLGAQHKLERAQTQALGNSARDAIGTAGAAAARERESEELTRSNQKEIRNATGAADPVHPGVNDAGLRALCRRAAYRDSERCRLRAAPPP